MISPTSRTAIAATGPRKSFGDKVVLDGIDLHVAEGTVFALLGPNGWLSVACGAVDACRVQPRPSELGAPKEVRPHIKREPPAGSEGSRIARRATSGQGLGRPRNGNLASRSSCGLRPSEVDCPWLR
jgi:hypothetical protein